MWQHFTYEPTHGSPGLPLGLYRNQAPAGDCLLYTHWHDDCEFFQLLQGSARFSLGSRSLLLQPGDLVYLAPGELHGAWNIGPGVAEFRALVCAPALLLTGPPGPPGSQPDSMGRFAASLLLSASHTGQGTAPLNPDGPPGVHQLLDRLQACWDQPASWRDYELRSLIYALLAALVRQLDSAHCQTFPPAAGSGSGPGSGELQAIKRLLDRIHHQTGPLPGVRELAAGAAMSPGNLMRLFRRYTGCTLMDYQVRYRLEQAATLLLQTTQSIGAIARETGFNSPSHFIRRFKEARGTTPARFRQAAMAQKHQEMAPQRQAD